MAIKAIIQRIKGGEKSAFKELYDLYSREMYSSSFRITNNKEESKDILQESFIKSFESILTLKDETHYKAWLKKIVINKSLEYLRLSKHYVSNAELESSDALETSNWFKGISLEHIKKEVQFLSKKSRAVFTLYAFEGLQHKEIATYLNIAESTSKSQYRYACNSLKDKLIKYVDYEI